jgi:hypothetical protein
MRPWSAVLDNGVVIWLRDHRALPEAYLYGFAHVMHKLSGRAVFLHGDTSTTGFLGFFPLAFLIKTSPFVLLALVLACLLRPRPSTTLWLFALVYFSVAVHSRMNLGHRHLLPVYPALFIVAGAAARFRLAPLLPGLLAVESLMVWPNYMAYFSPLIGGSDGGYHYLVDSSLDWGQELPAIAREVETRALSPVFYAHFGTSRPHHYGIAGTNIMSEPWDDGSALPVLLPGYYFLSATLFQGPYTRYSGPWTPAHEDLYRQASANLDAPGARQALRQLRFRRLCERLRGRAPDKLINHAVLLYAVTAEDLGMTAPATS